MKIYFENGNYCEPIGSTSKKLKDGGCILGEGKEGIVYKVRYSADNGIYALKIYKNQGAHAARYAPGSPFIENLKKNITDGSPSDSFVWPIAITKPFKNNKMGYLMEMYSSNFTSFSNLYTGKVRFAGMQQKIRAMIEIAEAFRLLHSKGKSFQDFNDGGVVFDVKTGEVKICDCDNIAPYGENFGILGKGSYMAPEIKAKIDIRPDSHSDCLSLAAVFFELLTHGEPYNGRFTSDEDVKVPGYENDDGPIPANVLYGNFATFIFDPEDTSNRPSSSQKVVTRYWQTVPRVVQGHFVSTFTKGMPKKFMRGLSIDVDALIIDRQQRVRPETWLTTLYKWHNSIFACPNCGVGSILYVISKPNVKLGDTHCVKCKTDFPIDFPILEFVKSNVTIHAVPVTDGKKFYSFHTGLSGRQTVNGFKVIAEGMLSKNYDPKKNAGRRVFFIKNKTGEDLKYSATYPDGIVQEETWKVDGFIACKNGIKVEFAEGCEIRIHSPFGVDEWLIKNQ